MDHPGWRCSTRVGLVFGNPQTELQQRTRLDPRDVGKAVDAVEAGIAAAAPDLPETTAIKLAT